MNPRRLIDEEHPGAIRVSRPDGTKAIVQNPVFTRDSLTVTTLVSPCSEAMRLSCAAIRSDLSPVPMVERLAVDDLGQIEVRRVSAVRTMALAVPSFLLMIAVAVCSTGCGPGV